MANPETEKREAGTLEHIRSELALKRAQRDAVKARAKRAAAEAEARFAEEISQLEFEIYALQQRLKDGGGPYSPVGDDALFDLKEGLAQSGRALSKLARAFLDRL